MRWDDLIVPTILIALVAAFVFSGKLWAQDGTQCDVDWPESITKADLSAWYSAATEGEKKAVECAYIEVANWRGALAHSFFGEAITPSRVQGVIRDACKHWNVPELRLLTYDYMRPTIHTTAPCPER